MKSIPLYTRLMTFYNLFPSTKKKKKKRADDGDAPALTLWSKAATSVDTTPSLSVRSRKIRRLAVKEGEEDGMQRSSEISLDATVEGGDLCRQLTDMHPGQEWGYFIMACEYIQ